MPREEYTFYTYSQGITQHCFLSLVLLPVEIQESFVLGQPCSSLISLLYPFSSEHAPQTAQLLAKLFPLYLDTRCFRVVLGSENMVKSLLTRPWGHILFTGSSGVGKIVMREAAKFLTPVTLELGGRNAVVVSDKANVELAAKRTVWGKVTTAGQTCFAPNVAIVHEAVYEEFVQACCQVSSNNFWRILL